jgi:hypothetical protein
MIDDRHNSAVIQKESYYRYLMLKSIPFDKTNSELGCLTVKSEMVVCIYSFYSGHNLRSAHPGRALPLQGLETQDGTLFSLFSST